MDEVVEVLEQNIHHLMEREEILSELENLGQSLIRKVRSKIVARVGAWTGKLKDLTKYIWRGSPIVGPTSSV